MDPEHPVTFPTVSGIEYSFPIENWLPYYTKEGIKLHTYKYPAKSPRCLVISIHGLHSCSNSHSVIAHQLSEIGCEVVAFDLRGHGRSEGPRGVFPSFELILQDSIGAVKEILSHYPGLPVFLLGRSIGGALSIHINHALPGVFRGVVFLCPAFGTDSSCEGCLRCCFSCFGSCCPGLGLTKPNYKKLNKGNLALCDYLANNPDYYSGRARVGSLASVFQGMYGSRRLFDKVKTPFVTVHGTEDDLANFRYSEQVYQKAPIPDKNIWIYSGLGHGFIYDKEIYEIARRVCEWIETRINS